MSVGSLEETDLRDLFAGLALIGIAPLAIPFRREASEQRVLHPNDSNETVAAIAYQFADAMLEARKRPIKRGK